MTDSLGLTLNITTVVLSVVVYLWTAVGLSAVFRKWGDEGWKGWVPVYNEVVLLEKAGMSGWLLLFLLLPILGWLIVYVVHIAACHRLNVAFGLPGGMTALAALLFPVWASVVGFGSARWLGHPEDIGGPLRTESPTVGLYRDWAPDGPADASRAAPDEVAAPRTPAPATGPLEWAPGVAPAAQAEWAPGVPADPEPSARPGSGTDAAPAPVSFAPAPAPVSRTSGRPGESAPEEQEHGSLLSAASSPSTRAEAREQQTAPVEEPAAPFWFDEDDLEVSAIAPAAEAPYSAASAARARRAGWEAAEDDVSYPAADHPLDDEPAVSDPSPAPASQRSDDALPAPPAPAAAPLVTRVPAARPEEPSEPWAPRRSPLPESAVDTTDEVSAVAGAPMAGSPRSALGAVAALYARAELSDDDVFDETIVARRRRVEWELIPPVGKPIDIVSDVLILGRRPVADPRHPSAQLVPIADETRTVSKTHARLELRGDQWMITDLGSTNGVLLPTLMGTELEAQPGVEVAAGERFFLGDAEVSLRRSAT